MSSILPTTPQLPITPLLRPERTAAEYCYKRKQQNRNYHHNDSIRSHSLHEDGTSDANDFSLHRSRDSGSFLQMLPLEEGGEAGRAVAQAEEGDVVTPSHGDNGSGGSNAEKRDGAVEASERARTMTRMRSLMEPRHPDQPHFNTSISTSIAPTRHGGGEGSQMLLCSVLGANTASSAAPSWAGGITRSRSPTDALHANDSRNTSADPPASSFYLKAANMYFHHNDNNNNSNHNDNNSNTHSFTNNHFPSSSVTSSLREARNQASLAAIACMLCRTKPMPAPS